MTLHKEGCSGSSHTVQQGQWLYHILGYAARNENKGLWKPEIGTFLKPGVRFLSWGLKHSAREPFHRKGFHCQHYFRKVLDKASDWIWGLLSCSFMGCWDHFRSLNERTTRTVLERSQVALQIQAQSQQEWEARCWECQTPVQCRLERSWARASHRLVTLTEAVEKEPVTRKEWHLRLNHLVVMLSFIFKDYSTQTFLAVSHLSPSQDSPCLSFPGQTRSGVFRVVWP